MWPNKHVLRRRIQQPTIKQMLSHSSHKYEHEYHYPNNILSGDQPPQVLNYQLAMLIQTKWNLSVSIPMQPKDSLAQVDT